jgi:glycosyltransferase involved in cell wall biosynthesis
MPELPGEEHPFVGRRGRALFFGTYDVRLHPRVAALRDGLAAVGWSVEELDVPLGVSTAEKVDAAGSPLAAVRVVVRLVTAWARLVVRRARVRRPDVVVVGYMGHLDVHLARLLFPRTPVALDHLVSLSDTVRDRGLGGGWKLRILDRVDRAALRAARVIVVDTQDQAETLPTKARDRAVVVPVGATDEWFAAADHAAARCDPGPLRVVFYGLFTPLQGTPTIGDAIAALAGEPVRFTMVGGGQDSEETRRRARSNPDATWVDWVDAEALPNLVASHDVCLGVFGVGPKARRVVPTKVYQGLAAGCVVVTADTPAVSVLLADGVITVPPGRGDDLADALRLFARDRAVLAASHETARRAAERFRPAAIVADLDAALRQASR